MSAALKACIRLMNQAEAQARKNLRAPGDSHQTITIRAKLYVKQDKAGKVSIGGSVATNLPTEPLQGEIEGGWVSNHVTGLVGVVELEKVIVLTEGDTE